MKKYGYISHNASEQDMDQLSPHVTSLNVSDQKLSESDSFIEFLTMYKHQHIVLLSLESLGKSITLVQLKPALEAIEKDEIKITVLDKGDARELSDKKFLSFILSLLKQDTRARSYRTLAGIEFARSEGRVGGRPSITEEKIKEVQDLYYKGKKNYREVSAMSGVALGTAYKYIQMAEEDKLSQNKREVHEHNV